MASLSREKIDAQYKDSAEWFLENLALKPNLTTLAKANLKLYSVSGFLLKCQTSIAILN